MVLPCRIGSAAGAAAALPAAPAARADAAGQHHSSRRAGRLAILQHTDASFIPKTGCFSCQADDSFTASRRQGLARRRGFRVDEKLSARQVAANAGLLQTIRDLAGAPTLPST